MFDDTASIIPICNEGTILMESTENRELFLNNGIKNTRQRHMIFNILKKAKLPITAEQIYFMLKDEDSSISLSTVYRILDLFVNKELAVKSNISKDNKSMFELNRMEHKHHLICVQCKNMMVFENCPLEGYEKILEGKTHFEITGHKLEIFGLCPKCKP